MEMMTLIHLIRAVFCLVVNRVISITLEHVSGSYGLSLYIGFNTGGVECILARRMLVWNML